MTANMTANKITDMTANNGTANKKALHTYTGCFIMTLFAINITVLSPLILSISRSFSLSVAEAGVVFSANFIGFVISVLAGGTLADRVGKKRVLLVSIAGFSLTLFTFPLAPDFTTACAVIFLMGGFGGILESQGSALVSDLNPEKRSFYVNLSQIFFGIGALAGPVTAGFAVSSGVDWRVCYYVQGVLALIITIVLIPQKIAGPGLDRGVEITPDSRRVVRSLFGSPVFLLICLCMLLYTGSEVGGWGWMCTLLEESYGFTVAASGIAVAVFWTAMTIGRIFCGVLTLKFDIVRIITVLAFLSFIFTGATFFVRSELLLWIIIIVMGFSYSSQFPLIAAYGSSRTSAPSGLVFSLLIGSGGIGSTTVPYFMGLIGDAAGMRFAMLLPALLLLIVGVIFSRFRSS